MMKQELRVGLHQTQRMAMTQNLRQSIEMLQLNNLELSQRIEYEVMENPMLELVDSYEDVSSGYPDEEPSKTTGPDAVNEMAWENSFNNTSPSEFSRQRDDKWSVSDRYRSFQEADQFQNFIEGTVTREKTFKDNLFEQAAVFFDSEKERKLADLIVSSLDNHGFLTMEPLELAASCGFDDEDMVREVLEAIRNMDPIGTATSGVRESLLVQAMIRFPRESLLHRLILERFDELGRNHKIELARKYRVSLDEISRALDLLSQLEPYPAYKYGGDAVRYIMPDLTVWIKDGDPIIIVNDHWMPRVQVNSSYAEMLAEMKKDKSAYNAEDRAYLSRKLDSAKWLIRGIEQRKKSLIRVMEAIVERQYAFFCKGPSFLRPLTLQDIADDVSLHKATVSRLTSGKYVETKWGIYELKTFFLRSFQTEDGGDIASRDIERRIRDMIEREETVLTDQQIAQKLQGEGISIARRTVAKYREALSIPTSSARKKMKNRQKKA